MEAWRSKDIFTGGHLRRKKKKEEKSNGINIYEHSPLLLINYEKRALSMYFTFCFSGWKYVRFERIQHRFGRIYNYFEKRKRRKTVTNWSVLAHKTQGCSSLCFFIIFVGFCKRKEKRTWKKIMKLALCLLLFCGSHEQRKTSSSNANLESIEHQIRLLLLIRTYLACKAKVVWRLGLSPSCCIAEHGTSGKRTTWCLLWV